MNSVGLVLDIGHHAADTVRKHDFKGSRGKQTKVADPEFEFIQAGVKADYAIWRLNQLCHVQVLGRRWRILSFMRDCSDQTSEAFRCFTAHSGFSCQSLCLNVQNLALPDVFLEETLSPSLN